MSWLFVAGAAIVVFGWLGYRRRLAGVRSAGRLTDDAIRAIERGDRLEVEDPLDFGEAAEEEERFWGETWDEPEPM